MNDYQVKKCSEIDTCDNIVLLKRNIRLKPNLYKKSIRFMNSYGKMSYVFLQSKPIPILYGISEYCGYNFIDFPSSKSDVLTCIEKIQNSIIDKYSDIFTGLIFANNIQRNSIRFRYTQETKVFYHDKLFNEKLSKNSIVKLILCPREVWITGEKFGFNWDVIQIMLIESADLKVDENIFAGDDNNEDRSSKLYEKYIKMYKRGVPEGAVRNKMELDGLDRDYDLTGKKKDVCNIPKSKPSEERPNLGGLFSEIKGFGKEGLKKSVVNGNEKDKQKNKKGLAKINLSDILDMRKKLNRTGSKITSLLK